MALVNRSRMTGLVQIFFSVLLFSVMGLLVRSSRAEIGPITAAFWRSFLGFLMVLAVAGILREPIAGRPEFFRMMLVRSVSGATSLICFFLAITRVDLGTATSLTYTYPIFATILSAVILKERITGAGLASIVVAWIGVAVMTGFSPRVGMGELFGLLGGLLAGVAIFSLRSVRVAGESTAAVLALFLGISSAIALPLAWWEDPSLGLGRGREPHLLAIAAAATVAQAAMTAAYRRLTTRIASTCSLMVIPVSIAGAYVLLGELPGPTALIGGLILLAGLTGLAASGSAEQNIVDEIPRSG